MHRVLHLTTVLIMALLLLSAPPVVAQSTLFYVAPNGADQPGNGSASAPWATISYAVTRVPDGSTVLVRPGIYTGQVRLNTSFAQGITIRAEPAYQAQLRHNAAVVIVYTGRGITLDGFDVAHSGPGAGALLVQIQDLRGAQPGCADGDCVERITLRNNIFHDSYNNDIVKVNNGARNVTISGNLFYNQTGSDEHIDINSVTDVVVQDNIFMNDFAGSGRTNSNDTSAFVVIKDSNGTDDSNLGSQRITLRRNVFLNWEGSTGHGFVQIGEDGTANYEADGVLLENNLLLGNSNVTMRAPFAVMGSRNVTVRHNTVVGNLPVSSGYTMRLYTFGQNQPNSNIQFYNNIWSDPTGTMSRFADAPNGQTASLTLDNNLYWNGGQPVPTSASAIVNLANDAARVVADPLLGNQAGLVLPRWDANTARFADTSSTIRDAFVRLVTNYGTPGTTSPVIDRAAAAQSPTEDILGNPRPRGSTPDIGAREVPIGAPPPPLDRRGYLPQVVCSRP